MLKFTEFKKANYSIFWEVKMWSDIETWSIDRVFCKEKKRILENIKEY